MKYREWILYFYNVLILVTLVCFVDMLIKTIF